MNIPTYLENYVKDVQEKRLIELSIRSTAGNELFEVWYYGDLFEVKGEQQPYITETDAATEKIVAKDVLTGGKKSCCMMVLCMGMITCFAMNMTQKPYRIDL